MWYHCTCGDCAPVLIPVRPEVVPVYIYKEKSFLEKCRMCQCKLRTGEVILDVAKRKPVHRSCIHAILAESYDAIPQLPSEDVSLSTEGLIAAYREKLLEQWGREDAPSEDEQEV